MSSFLRRGHFVSEGGWGEGKKKARGGRWEEGREPFLSSHRPLRTYYLLIIAKCTISILHLLLSFVIPTRDQFRANSYFPPNH